MEAALVAILISAIGLGATGQSGGLIDRIAGAIGGQVGSGLAKRAPTPPAKVRVQVKGGDVCEILPRLGWPARLPEMTIQTIDGRTLRVILDTNDTVRECPK